MKRVHHKQEPVPVKKIEHLYKLPAAPLNNFIVAIWASQAHTSLQKIRIIPDGCGILLFNFDAPVQINTDSKTSQLTKIIFSGISSRYHDLTCTGSHNQVGIIFKPFGAYELINIPIQEFYNASIETDLIGKNSFSDIFEKMQAVHTAEERLALLENWLRLRLRNKIAAPGIHYLTSLLQTNDDLTAAQLAARAGFSQQHTARLFKKHVGAAPKTMQRIFRFQNALDVLANRRYKSLTDACYDAGYFDQAHFIHECKSLSGFTPKELTHQLFPEQKRVAFF